MTDGFEPILPQSGGFDKPFLWRRSDKRHGVGDDRVGARRRGFTGGQLCKNDGKYIICDSTMPMISGSSVGSARPRRNPFFKRFPLPRRMAALTLKGPRDCAQSVTEGRRNRHETRRLEVFDAKAWFARTPWERLIKTVLRLKRIVHRRDAATGFWTTSRETAFWVSSAQGGHRRNSFNLLTSLKNTARKSERLDAIDENFMRRFRSPRFRCPKRARR